MRVAAPPPRAGMQRAEAALRKQRVSIEWLAAYLLPRELEVVARASIFPGSFTADAAVAVGCRASPSEQQQPCTDLATGNRCDQEQLHVAAGVERVLAGLVLMSVLSESKGAYSGGQRFSMHPLIRELGRELLHGQQREGCGRDGVVLQAMMVQWMVGNERGPGARLLLHHPKGKQPNNNVCQGVVGEDGANFREAARLLGSEGAIGEQMAHQALLGHMLEVGDAMWQLGYFPQARVLQEAVVGVRTRLQGPEHPDTLTAMSKLATTLVNLEDLPGARELREKVVGACTRVLGPEHPDTLIAVSDLACSLQHCMGGLLGARELRERVVDASARVLGPEHPATLRAMGNLASSLYCMGDVPGARKLQDKVVGACTRVLGPEHPDTLVAMGDYAMFLERMGDVSGALALAENVLALSTRVLGPEHPDTLIAMNNLAITLEESGDLAAACELQEQVVDAFTRMRGPEHPETIAVSSNLSRMMWELGDTLKARALLERCVATAARAMGVEHNVTQHVAGMLASWQPSTDQQSMSGRDPGLACRLGAFRRRFALPLLLAAAAAAWVLRGRRPRRVAAEA
jgi:hypothetical protein